MVDEKKKTGATFQDAPRYRIEDIDSVSVSEMPNRTPKGKIKIKRYLHRKFKNGVVKSSLTNMNQGQAEEWLKQQQGKK